MDARVADAAGTEGAEPRADPQEKALEPPIDDADALAALDIRLGVACESCYNRKLKCTKPADAEVCDQCRAKGRTCVRRIERKRGRRTFHCSEHMQDHMSDESPLTGDLAPWVRRAKVVATSVDEPFSTPPPTAYESPTRVLEPFSTPPPTAYEAPYTSSPSLHGPPQHPMPPLPPHYGHMHQNVIYVLTATPEGEYFYAVLPIPPGTRWRNVASTSFTQEYICQWAHTDSHTMSNKLPPGAFLVGGNKYSRLAEPPVSYRVGDEERRPGSASPSPANKGASGGRTSAGSPGSRAERASSPSSPAAGTAAGSSPKPGASRRRSFADAVAHLQRIRGPVTLSGGRVRLNFGSGMLNDARLTAVLQREAFFLNVINNRHRSFLQSLIAFGSYFSFSRLFIIIGLLAVYASTAASCSGSSSSSSSSKEDSDTSGLLRLALSGVCGVEFSSRAAFADLYRPALLNSLAALLLSFYASAVVNIYRESYLAAAKLKNAVQTFMTLCVSEMGDQPNAAEVLLDLWRCCQLMHSSTYCLADRQGLVYTFESFLLPVAEAFGAHDSDEQLGMFLKPELIALGKGHLIARGVPVSLSYTPNLPDPTSAAAASPSRVGANERQTRAQQRREDDLMGDVLGDVRSDDAFVYQFYSIRLYRLVREAIHMRLTEAAWPVWGAALSELRGCCEDVQRRALYRMPNAYRMCVWVVVMTSLAIDAIIGGIIVGRGGDWDGGGGGEGEGGGGGARSSNGGGGYDAGEASVSAFSSSSSSSSTAVYTTLTVGVLIVPTVLLLAVCIELEEPFGDNTRDIPGLSYVRAAAEVTLNMVFPHPACMEAANLITAVNLQHHRLSTKAMIAGQPQKWEAKANLAAGRAGGASPSSPPPPDHESDGHSPSDMMRAEGRSVAHGGSSLFHVHGPADA